VRELDGYFEGSEGEEREAGMKIGGLVVGDGFELLKSGRAVLVGDAGAVAAGLVYGFEYCCGIIEESWAGTP
jgi:hypothetical protein